MVQFLLADAEKIGMDVLTVDDHGNTILHAVVSNNDCTFKMVKVTAWALVVANDDNLGILDKTNSDGKTALDIAKEQLSESLDRFEGSGGSDDAGDVEKWEKIVYSLDALMNDDDDSDDDSYIPLALVRAADDSDDSDSDDGDDDQIT